MRFQLLILLLAACGDNLRPDAAPDAGTGDAPDGSSDAAPALTCDDHNPCTDDRAVDGACRFDPAPDDRACDDGNFCTLGDHCRAGACVAGAPAAAGPLAQLGSLDSLAGGAIGAIGDRFLAVSGVPWGAHLHLAARRGDDLAIVSSWRGTLPFVFTEASDVLMQVFSGGSVVVAGRQDRSLAIFTVGDAAIDKRSELELPGQIVSMAARGDRIWACTRDFTTGIAVVLVDATDPAAPVVAGSLPLTAETACGASLAISDDGTRVFFNTPGGVRFIDASPLDTGGVPTLAGVFAPSAGVSTSTGHLILRTADTVRVLAQSDLSEQVSIPATGVLAAAFAGDRLVLEGYRTTPHGTDGFATLYSISGATATQLDEVIDLRLPFVGDSESSFTSALTDDGATLVTTIGQRMFDLAGGHFAELRAPVLAPLGLLQREAAGVRAIGFSSSAIVDAGDPQHPAFAGGGSYGLPIDFELGLEDTAPDPQLLFGNHLQVAGQFTVGASWERDPLPVDRWTLDDRGRATAAGSFLLPNRGAAQMMSAGGVLYRMRSPVNPSSDVALQGFEAAALGRNGEVAQPLFELPLSPSVALPAGGHRAAFDVDAAAEVAVVVTSTSEQASGHAALFWIDLSTSPPRVVDELALDGFVSEVRVSGDRAVLSTHLELISVARGQGVVARVMPSADAYIEHLLGFDGRTAYYSVTDFAAGIAVGLETAAFGDAGPVSPMLPLDDAATTMAEASGALVVGLPNQVVTVHPQCP